MKKLVLLLIACAAALPQLAKAQTSRPVANDATSQPTSAPTSKPTTAMEKKQAPSDFIAEIERAHGADEWRSQEAVEAEVRLEFGGSERLNGTLLFATDTSGTRIESGDTIMVWDGKKAWAAPADAANPRVRFNVLTWSYFMAAPFKLGDPGSYLEMTGKMKLQGEEYDTARLTFGDGVGDAPDDWYIVYKDPGSGALKSLAYIVTYGKTTEEAEKEPHAIVYEDFEEVDGVILPRTWYFYDWSAEEGVFGEPLGKMEISSIEFVKPADDAFVKPEGAAEAPLPGA